MLLNSLFKLDSTLSELDKSSLNEIGSFSHIEDPIENTVCFLSKKKYIPRIGRRSSSTKFNKTLLVVTSKLKEEAESIREFFDGVFITENMPNLIQKLSSSFYQDQFKDLNPFLDGRQLGNVELHPEANIGQNVFIGSHCIIEKNVEIHPGAVLYPYVHVKEGSTIFANVTLYPRTTIGQNSRIHSGSVIGADGFGYEFIDGEHKKIWHLGGVHIGDNVEISAGCTIDMGIMHATEIGDGTKIDSQVHIGHNCIVGNHCILCGQVGLAGSAVLEDFCVVGGRAAIGPDAYIGAGSQIAGAAVINDGAVLNPKSIVGGFPAKPLKQWMREVAYLSLSTRNRGK